MKPEAWEQAVLRIQIKEFLLYWILASGVGVLSGYAALGFRFAIARLEEQIYGVADTSLLTEMASLPWYVIVIIPVMGGLIVGALRHFLIADQNVIGVAEVIEAAENKENSHVTARLGLVSVLSALVTLSSGGSSGREGPVVVLGAIIAGKISKLMSSSKMTARDLLGAGVAAAVSASFNAPIAGAIFAAEVVLRDYSLRRFAPLAIASVLGALTARTSIGDIPEFQLAEQALRFYVEIPAFALLGILCGVVAVVTMRAIFWADDFATYLSKVIHIPTALRPACSGFLLGMIALYFPHIIGVGYQTTARALDAEIALGAAIIFAILKVIALAVTMAGRMGGGIFSPGLMIGALTGAAFGLCATAALPAFSGAVSLYALAGMGAVAAALLGAPISTALIVFELTGNWQVGMTVILAVSVSVAISYSLWPGSFFFHQIERRKSRPLGKKKRHEPAYMRMRSLTDLTPDENDQALALMAAHISIRFDDPIAKAHPLFHQGHRLLPVVVLEDEPKMIGVLRHEDLFPKGETGAKDQA